MPGIKKEDVTLKIKNGCLHVTARKGETNQAMNWGEAVFHKSERGLSRQSSIYTNITNINIAFGKVSRSLKLFDDAKASDVKVFMANGLLTVTIPKDEKLSHQEKLLPIEDAHDEKAWTVTAGVAN